MDTSSNGKFESVSDKLNNSRYMAMIPTKDMGIQAYRSILYAYLIYVNVFHVDRRYPWKSENYKYLPDEENDDYKYLQDDEDDFVIPSEVIMPLLKYSRSPVVFFKVLRMGSFLLAYALNKTKAKLVVENTRLDGITCLDYVYSPSFTNKPSKVLTKIKRAGMRNVTKVLLKQIQRILCNFYDSLTDEDIVKIIPKNLLLDVEETTVKSDELRKYFSKHVCEYPENQGA